MNYEVGVLDSVALKDPWSNREDGMQKRTVEEIDLYEISSVLDKTPAYIATSIEMRGEEEEVCLHRN